MSDFLEKWRFGVVLVFVVGLLAVGVPTIVMGMMAAVLTLAGIDFSNMNHLYTWILVCMGVLGPYFLGHGWNEIAELIDRIKPGSIKNI